MKLYELTYLISPELKEEEIKKVFARIESLLSETGGILIENKSQGTVKLGYEIKKQKEALSATAKFQMAPEKIKSFQEKIKEIPEILRFLVLAAKPEKIKKEVSKIIRKPVKPKKTVKEKKVELKEIEKKLEEILGE